MLERLSYPQVVFSVFWYNQYNMKRVYIFLVVVVFLGLAGLTFAAKIDNPLSSNNFGELLLKIAGAAGTLIASLGTIMIIVAGILYLLSAGSQEKMTKAKNALIYAIAGIAIGLAATAIVEVVKEIIGA